MLNKIPAPCIVLTAILLLAKSILVSSSMGLSLNSSITLSSLGILMAAISPALLFRSNMRKGFLFFADILLSALMLSDTLHFRYFGTAFTMDRFYESSNISGLGSSVWYLFRWSDALLFLDLPFLGFYFHRKTQTAAPRRRAFVLLLLAGVLVFLYTPVKDRIFEGYNTLRRYSTDNIIQEYGPLGFHVVDLSAFIQDMDLTLNDEMRQQIQDWYRRHQTVLAAAAPAPQYAGSGRGKNLIIIQVESLQGFVLGLSAEGQEITPHLNALLSDSLYFPNFYPQTAEGNSCDAELLVNTSLYPLKRGSAFFRYPRNVYKSLPHMLKELGYSTLAVHGDEANYWNRAEAYPSLGFDRFEDISDFEQDEIIGMGLGDRTVLRQTAAHLQEAKQPYYAFVITLTSHYPFEIPEKERTLRLGDEMNTSLLGQYLQSIHYTDEALGEFLAILKQNGTLDKSVLVIYGDHDGLFERDKPMVEKLLSKSPITTETWVRKYVTVPLLVRVPGMNGQRITAIGGQVDVLPTLASIMGVPETQYLPYAMGQNLLTVKGGSALLPSGDYITKAGFVTPQEIREKLDGDEKQTLNISNLIIRSNYFGSSH